MIAQTDFDPILEYLTCDIVCDRCYKFIYTAQYYRSLPIPENLFALCDFCLLKQKNIIDILGDKF